MKRLSFQWQRCGYNSFLPCDLVTILCHDAAARLRGELAKRKLICISADDPLADKLQDIEDVYTYFPGTVSGIREWFRWYKTPDGKPLNVFAFNEEAINKQKSLEVIAHTHDSWKQLYEGEILGGKMWIG